MGYYLGCIRLSIRIKEKGISLLTILFINQSHFLIFLNFRINEGCIIHCFNNFMATSDKQGT